MVIVGRSQLVRNAAEKSGNSQKLVGEVLDAILSDIAATVAAGGEVKLPGYLTIGVKTRSARTGRNPRTGMPLQIAEKVVPTVKAGKTLKDAAEGASVS